MILRGFAFQHTQCCNFLQTVHLGWPLSSVLAWVGIITVGVLPSFILGIFSLNSPVLTCQDQMLLGETAPLDSWKPSVLLLLRNACIYSVMWVGDKSHGLQVLLTIVLALPICCSLQHSILKCLMSDRALGRAGIRTLATGSTSFRKNEWY